MAWVSTNAISATSSVDNNGDDSYTVVYRVIYDSLVGPDTARFASGLPSLWVSAYTGAQAVGGDSNVNAFCKSKEAAYESPPTENDEGSLFVFVVTCTYDTKLDLNSKRVGTSADQDPLAVWEASLSYRTGTELTNKDKDDNIILNAVEEVKVVQIPSGDDTLVLKGNTATLSLSTRAAAVGKTNSVAMWGFGARELYLNQWQATTPWRGATQYVHHRLEFLIDEDKWNTQLFEESTKELISAVGVTPKVFAPILNGAKPITQPVPLDNDGKKLDLVANPNGIDPTEKEVIKETDFLSFGILPTTLPGPFV